MQQKRTLSIGGATYDLFVRTGAAVTQTCANTEVFALPVGEKIRVQEVIETCGGGASNTSVGLSRLGCDAHYCGVVGDDQWGGKLAENFKQEGVNLDCMTIAEKEVSSFSIILSAGNGERTILYEPGTNEHLHNANFAKETAATMHWIYLNHIQEHSCVIQEDISEILTADDNLKFTWNPGGCQLGMGIEEPHHAKLLASTDLLLLNAEEAQKFSRKNTSLDALRALADTGPAIVCMTDGANGTLATNGTTLYRCPVNTNGNVVDTTGAGDAFGTAFSWAIMQGEDLPTALLAGTLNAASVVGTIGAQAGLLTDTEMRHRLQQTQISVEESLL